MCANIRQLIDTLEGRLRGEVSPLFVLFRKSYRSVLTIAACVIFLISTTLWVSNLIGSLIYLLCLGISLILYYD